MTNPENIRTIERPLNALTIFFKLRQELSAEPHLRPPQRRIMRRMVTTRPAAVPTLRHPPDPYEALGDVLGDTVANLFRQLLPDVKEVVEAAIATIPPSQVAADTMETVGMKEAARRLDIGVTTLRRIISEGLLPVLSTGEGRKVVSVTDLHEYVVALRAQAPVPAPPLPAPSPEPSRPSSGRRLARSAPPQESMAR